jgi:predicted transglutaminase-like cysteine proteinase
MKKMMIATVLLATLSTVQAQETAAPAKPTQDPAVTEQRAAEKAEKRTEMMTQELGLSADQVSKVQVINDRFARSMAELHQAKLIEEAEKERVRWCARAATMNSRPS